MHLRINASQNGNCFYISIQLFLYYFQAVRYLMRFKSDYMCGLMNDASHAAFGKEAAKLVLTSLPREWPKVLSL